MNEGQPISIRLASPQVGMKCPPLLRNVAEEMAGVFYDANRSKVFRQTFPRQRHYVAAHWHEFVTQARDSLLQMLHSPAYNEHVKNTIYDAITNDIEGRTVQLSLDKRNANITGNH